LVVVVIEAPAALDAEPTIFDVLLDGGRCGLIGGKLWVEIEAEGGVAVVHAESIATWDGARSVIDRCVDALGGLDGVVNNAGIYYTCASHEQQRGRLETIVEVNLLGAMYVGTHAMRVMVEHGHGAIVNNASASHMGAPGTAAYAATKGALATLTYCWAIDIAPYGVRVNAFSPNASTRMTAESVNPAARNAPPVERNVPAVIYLLSDHADGISGQIVQLRDNDLVVLAHPQLTDVFATADEWTPDTVLERFDPVLRANLQPVGWGPAVDAAGR
jgi:NAD(P)-dependent dehydrogenase (short-subunit alcohol dehydrogenase family)